MAIQQQEKRFSSAENNQDKTTTNNTKWGKNCTDSSPPSPRTTLVQAFQTAIDAISLESCEKKTVSFSSVQLREHNVILGDHDADHGFPLALDWKHAPERTIDIDDYEDGRRSCRGESKRGEEVDRLTVEERQARLRFMGYTRAALRQAETRRKIRVTHAWAYGNSAGEATPPSISKDDTIFCVQRYIL